MALPIVLALLAVVPCCILGAADNDAVYADPILSLNDSRQDATSHGDLKSINRLLNNQMETLVKIMAKIEHNEEMTKNLMKQIENVTRVAPEANEKIKASYPNNRRNNEDNEEIPIVKIGKNIVKYGNLLKTVVMTDFTNDPDPTAGSYKESSEDALRSDDDSDLDVTENYFDRVDTNEIEQSLAIENSVWCSIAAKCNRTFTDICGFDDLIGLAKFNNICHMLQINCYWNFNFSIAPC